MTDTFNDLIEAKVMLGLGKLLLFGNRACPRARGLIYPGHLITGVNIQRLLSSNTYR
jgi:hypothetical protein